MTKTSAHDAARPRTLAEKVWDDHVVASGGDTEPDLIYIDLHLVHEVTSPQGDSAMVCNTPTALSRTPMPLSCLTERY